MMAELLPLGSIVRAGSDKQMMIIGRALSLTVAGETYYVDYAACCFPEGVIKDTMVYFNSEDITELVQQGYTDEENESWLEAIGDAQLTMTIPKCDTRQVRAAAQHAARSVR